MMSSPTRTSRDFWEELLSETGPSLLKSIIKNAYKTEIWREIKIAQNNQTASVIYIEARQLCTNNKYLFEIF